MLGPINRKTQKMELRKDNLIQIKNALTFVGIFNHKNVHDDDLKIISEYNDGNTVSCQLMFDIRIGDKQYNIYNTYGEDPTKLTVKVFEMTDDPENCGKIEPDEEFGYMCGISLSKDGTYFIDEPSGYITICDDGLFEISGDLELCYAVLKELNERTIQCTRKIMEIGWKIFDK